MPFIVRA